MSYSQEQSEELVILLADIYPKWATARHLSSKTNIEEKDVELCLKASLLAGYAEHSKTRNGSDVWRMM